MRASAFVRAHVALALARLGLFRLGHLILAIKAREQFFFQPRLADQTA